MTLTGFASKLTASVKMLTSDNDAEVAAGGRAIVRLIEGRGRDIHAFAEWLERKLLEPRRQAPQPRQRATPAWSAPSEAERQARLARARVDGRKAAPRPSTRGGR